MLKDKKQENRTLQEQLQQLQALCVESDVNADREKMDVSYIYDFFNADVWCVILWYMAWCGIIWYGIVWYGMVWYCLMWYTTISYDAMR